MKRKLDVILEGVKESGDIQTGLDAGDDYDVAYNAFREDLQSEELILFCPRCKCENFPSDYGPLEQMECYLCGFAGDRSDFKNA